MLFYSRGMEIMLSTGVHLQEALALAEELLPKLLRKQIAPVREAVDSGKSLREAYSMVPMFKRMYVGLGDELFWLKRILVDFSNSLRFHPEN